MSLLVSLLRGFTRHKLQTVADLSHFISCKGVKLRQKATLGLSWLFPKNKRCD